MIFNSAQCDNGIVVMSRRSFVMGNVCLSISGSLKAIMEVLCIMMSTVYFLMALLVCAHTHIWQNVSTF